MPTKTIPLYGSLIDRTPLTFGADQDFINCFPEITRNPISDERSVFLKKRFGASEVVETASGNLSSYAGFQWDGKADGTMPAVLAFTKSTSDAVRIYRLATSSTVTQIGGDIANTAHCLFLNETSISGTSNITGVMTDSATSAKEVWYFPEGGAWTQITDGDFPPNQGTPLPITPYIAHLDGYMFVMCENGQIWNSDVNSIANWTATSFISAQASSDFGTGIVRYKDYILGLGSKTIEVFYNAGNTTGSPLSRVANGTINIGVARADSSPGVPMAKLVNGTLYFIGVDPGTFVHGFYRLNGLQAEKLSSPAVDGYLASGAFIDGIVGSFMADNKRHIMFYGSSTSRNLCYCIDSNFFWFMKLASQASSPRAIVTGTYGLAAAAPTTYFNNYTNADSVYRINNDSVWTDAGASFEMIMQTSGLDFGTDERKFVTDIWLDADTQSSGTATLEKSDDDYATWQTLGTFDMTKHEKRITRCGAHEGERAYRLTHSANTAFRARALRIKYAVA